MTHYKKSTNLWIASRGREFLVLTLPLLISSFLLLTSYFLLPASAEAATLSRPANNLGLVAYYSFNEGTGTQAGDFSGKGNHGTTTNMAEPPTATSGWTSAGKLGSALNFDGINDYVNANNSSSLDTSVTNKVTVSGWIKLNTFSTWLM